MVYHHETNSEVMERRAINSTGRVGSFYDATQDLIIIESPITCRIEQNFNSFFEIPIRKLIKDRTYNLLQTIGIEDELRLSLLMNLTTKDGISKVLDYPSSFDENTRFLYYSWIDSEFKIERILQTADIIQWHAARCNATHIVTGIRYGIDFIAVIQLLPKADIQKVDTMLETISNRLSCHTYITFHDVFDVFSFLDNNVVLNVYSNIPLLADSNNFYDLLWYTQAIKDGFSHCYPLSYILQSIPSLCQMNIRTLVYKPLPLDLIDHIEYHMLQFRNIKRDIIFILKRIITEPSCSLCTQLLDQFRSVKDQYTAEKYDFANMIVKARNNALNTYQIFHALHDDEQIDLIEDINKLIQDMKAVFNKHPFILQFEQLRFDCLMNTCDEIKTSVDKENIRIISRLNITLHTPLPRMEIETAPIVTTSPEKITNILLLGETGVGKSTFINAFANYITFDSLEQAKENEPVVIIPVSFLLTVGDDFEEKTIKFGEIDSLNNENFNDIGQSVTQHCKSYVFNVGKSDKKIRIIDTPGFGDTRGVEQDDKNIEHILQYISNLTHLNAICFLLKPNSTRLNIYFRTCLMQIFSFLDPSAQKNVIFCFTNGRSTFYTPGDTAPLLKTMLKSISIKDARFEKDNTFCFDSESFRYLVALRNDIAFPDTDKREYERSWLISVKESNRFVDYIDKQTTIDLTNHEWQSVKHAQFQISYMIRPLLETMRNILRNLIISEKTQCIELQAKSVCVSCEKNAELIGDFWILPNSMYDMQNNVLAHYIIEYHLARKTSQYDTDVLNEGLEFLCNVSAKFVHFLAYTKDDPFIIGLERMIEDETFILHKHQQADFNRQLMSRLKQLKDRYNELKQKSDHESKILVNIYDMIDKVNEYPMMAEQMKAVKETQRNMMKQSEHEL